MLAICLCTSASWLPTLLSILTIIATIVFVLGFDRFDFGEGGNVDDRSSVTSETSSASRFVSRGWFAAFCLVLSCLVLSCLVLSCLSSFVISLALLFSFYCISFLSLVRSSSAWNRKAEREFLWDIFFIEICSCQSEYGPICLITFFSPSLFDWFIGVYFTAFFPSSLFVYLPPFRPSVLSLPLPHPFSCSFIPWSDTLHEDQLPAGGEWGVGVGADGMMMQLPEETQEELEQDKTLQAGAGHKDHVVEILIKSSSLCRIKHQPDIFTFE